MPPKHYDAIDQVMSLTPGGMRDGRDHVLQLMILLGNPQDSLRVFHVTGSNGKGSVCQMISQVLWKQFHKKVGLFTSPHFIHINERFQINGVSIPDEKLNAYYERVIQLSKDHTIPLSFFEIQVVVMVLYFVDEKVDYAVVEVGLGGTYDGTNIFSHPLACFITSITLEHTHVLGKTRKSVLKNKLGIVKPGTCLYTPLNNALVRGYCEENNSKLWTVNGKQEMENGKLWTVNREQGANNYERGTMNDQQHITNLPGKHQQTNARLVLQCLIDQGFDETTIRKGLQDIEHHGRFEWIAEHILVDTANNRENIRLLERTLSENLPTERKGKKLITLFGTTQIDPAYAARLAMMIPTDIRILVDDFCDRALPSSLYEKGVIYAERVHFSKEKEKIKKYLSKKENTVLIYGSFYLVGEIMKLSRI